MSTITRRDFLAGLAAGGTLALAGRLALAAEGAAKVKAGSDLVALGRTGLRLSVLGMGTGTVSGDQQRGLGQTGFTKLFRHGLDQGVRYIDTADSYRIHSMIATALQEVPRDNYFLLTKTGARTAEKARADLDRYCRELKVDHLDCLLMHCMTKGGWQKEMQPVIDALLAEKEKGRIRALGVSCHGWDPLVSAVETDGIDVHLVRINPFDKMMDGEHEKVAGQIRRMHEKGRGVLGMKIFGENGLQSPEQRQQSLRYVLGLGTVHAFTIGFTSTQQMDETLEMIAAAAKPA